jgi:hypothetical protein
VADIQAWPEPQDVKQLRSFLGLTGYYRKFVQHYAIVARPLTDLLKKGVLFVWTSTHSVAFNTLKQALISGARLAGLHQNIPFAN